MINVANFTIVTPVSENPFVSFRTFGTDILTTLLNDTFRVRAATLYKTSDGMLSVVNPMDVTLSAQLQDLGVTLSIVNVERINPYEV